METSREPMTTPVIQAIDLVKYFPIYGGFIGRKVEYLKAVDSVSLTIHQGETLGLVGESGCGKTTVGYLILHLLKLDRGNILFKGVDVSTLRGHELQKIRKNLQVVFQDPQSSLDPRMLIKKTVGYPLEVNGIAKGAEVVTRVKTILSEVGLDEDHMYRYPHEFSGGQRQRIAIARSLSTSPKLVILDEPISSLDVSIRAQTMNLLLNLQNKLGLTYLLIAHDLAVILHMSTRVGVMYVGKMVESADSMELYGHPAHPYTTALFRAAFHDLEGERSQETMLPGEVASPLNPPPGCRFHPRCSYAMAICKDVEPELKDIAPGHKVACHLMEK